MPDSDARLIRWIDNIIGFTELSRLDESEPVLDNADAATLKVGKRGVLKKHRVPLGHFGGTPPDADR